MHYQQNHLFIGEQMINSKIGIQKCHPQNLYYSYILPSISRLKSSVSLHPIDRNHHHHHQIFSRIGKIAHLNNQQPASTRQPFSFLFLSYPFTRFTFLFCLFIVLYLFSSSLHQPTSSESSVISNTVQITMASDTPFDVVKVCECLKRYNEDVSALSLDLYIEAYKELQK